MAGQNGYRDLQNVVLDKYINCKLDSGDIYRYKVFRPHQINVLVVGFYVNNFEEEGIFFFF